MSSLLPNVKQQRTPAYTINKRPRNNCFGVQFMLSHHKCLMYMYIGMICNYMYMYIQCIHRPNSTHLNESHVHTACALSPNCLVKVQTKYIFTMLRLINTPQIHVHVFGCDTGRNINCPSSTSLLLMHWFDTPTIFRVFIFAGQMEVHSPVIIRGRTCNLLLPHL